MMSKERLEEIRNRMIVEKHYFKYLNNEKGYWENVYTLLEQDMKYLFDTIIEQADRVQELEEDSKDAKFAIDMLQAENQRYKQALEDIRRILDLCPHIDYSKSVTRRRLFDLANEALEGEE